MDFKKMKRIFEDTAFVHVSGTEEEEKVARYLLNECKALNVEARIEEFQISGGTVTKSHLFADGKEIPANAYIGSGSCVLEAPFEYLSSMDKASLRKVKGKIAIINGWISRFDYQDIVDNGAVGFIITNGNVNFKDSAPDKRFLVDDVCEGRKIPGMQINVKQAVKLVKNNVKTLRFEIEQEEHPVTMKNVIAEIPGKIDEWVVCTAHFDSTYLSKGTWDNMTGCVALLDIMEKLVKTKDNNYGVRFVFCGGEEEGLFGSVNYLKMHEAEIEKIKLNINVDMIGEPMGTFKACCTAEDKLAHHLEYLALEQGFGMKAYSDVYSSDSTSFADKGIPAVTFARMCHGQYASFHNCYDTIDILSMKQMQADTDFITAFAKRIACAVQCPVERKMPEKMRKKIDVYLNRKREDEEDED